MSAHITPLSRSQLLELEALFEKLVATLRPAHSTRSFHTHTSCTVNSTEPSLSARSSPCSVNASSPLAPEGDEDGVVGNACAGGSTTSSMPNDRSCLDTPRDHPSLHGHFFDVFEDPLTKHAWRLYDKVLYLVWWSYRPVACMGCGMTDAWLPSGTCELQCAQCGGEAGSTRLNDYVDSAGDDDDDDDGDGGGGGDGGMLDSGKISEEVVSSAVPSYIFFYEWLQHIPLVRFGGEHSVGAGGSSHAGVGGSGAHTAAATSYASSSSAPVVHKTDARSRTAGVSAAMNARTGRAVHQAAGAAATTDVAASNTAAAAAGEVALPVAEELAMVLRAAYDLSTVLVLPGMATREQSSGVRATALYLSLLLHRYAVPFPLFCLAREGVREGASTVSAAKQKSATLGTTSTASTINTNTNTTRADRGVGEELDIQWVDVEFYAELLGVALTDFFESPLVAAQYLQNAMTVTGQLGGVPSLLWHPARLPNRMANMMALADERRPVGVGGHASRISYGLSPEHTAMLVALELARQVDAQPIAKCSTSTAAAGQNAVRLGEWLDSLGLYPQRRLYRPARAFDSHEAFIASLTSLCAISSDEMESSKPTSDKNSGGATTPTHEDEPQKGKRPSQSGSAKERAVVVLPGSPFADDFEVLLLSPCANAMLHIFARVFGVTPLELCELAERSGLYKGPTRFLAVLRERAEAGSYGSLPLCRRLSPSSSPWISVYAALHSPDRLATLSTLRLLNDTQNGSHDRAVLLSSLLQKIMHKHHATAVYQLNYVVRVSEETEPHFKGLYYVSSVEPQEGLVTFTCLRSGRKTITLNQHTRLLTLCYISAKEKVVSRLAMDFLGPVVASLEGETTRLILSAVLGRVELFDAWTTVVRHLDLTGRIRRRMRVPMLASRLDALASIREAAAAAAMSRSTLVSAATLAGWGATETLLAAPPLVEPLSLRSELQHQLYSLPSAAFLYGLSENRVIGMYAAQLALLEFIEEQIQAHQQANVGMTAVVSTPSSPAKMVAKYPVKVKNENEGEGDVKNGDSFHGTRQSTGSRNHTSPSLASKSTFAISPTQKPHHRRRRHRTSASGVRLDSTRVIKQENDEEADEETRPSDSPRSGGDDVSPHIANEEQTSDEGEDKEDNDAEETKEAAEEEKSTRDVGLTSHGRPPRPVHPQSRRRQLRSQPHTRAGLTLNDDAMHFSSSSSSSSSSVTTTTSRAASVASSRSASFSSQESVDRAVDKGKMASQRSPTEEYTSRARQGRAATGGGAHVDDVDGMEKASHIGVSAAEALPDPLPPCWVEELLASEELNDATAMGGFVNSNIDAQQLFPDLTTGNTPLAVPSIRQRLSPPTGPGAARASPPLRPSQGQRSPPLPLPPPPPRTQHTVMTPVLGPATPRIAGMTVVKRQHTATPSPPPPLPPTRRRMQRSNNYSDEENENENEEDADPPLPPLTLSESVVPLPTEPVPRHAASSSSSPHALALAKELRARRRVLAHLQHGLPDWLHVLMGHSCVGDYLGSLEALACAAEKTSARDGHGEGVDGVKMTTSISRQWPSGRGRRGAGAMAGIEAISSTASTALLRAAAALLESPLSSSSINSPVMHGAVGATAAREGLTPTMAAASLASSAFHMFDADCCRHQLHNLYVFLHKYGSFKRRLYVLAKQDTLPAPPPPPPQRGRGVAAGGTSPHRTSNHTSPFIGSHLANASKVSAGAREADTTREERKTPLHAQQEQQQEEQSNRSATKVLADGQPSTNRKRRRRSSSDEKAARDAKKSNGKGEQSFSDASSFSSSSSTRSASMNTSRSHSSASSRNDGESHPESAREAANSPSATDKSVIASSRAKNKKSGRRRRRLEKRQEDNQKRRTSPPQSPNRSAIAADTRSSSSSSDS